MKASSHPKIIIDVDPEFKQLLVDICQLKRISMKEYILCSLEEKMELDSEKLKNKLEIFRSLRE
ncbi:hypothetical protein HOH45_07565 [bacterium]|jgi:hypothetical protein|nr:hypothetical protein [bacterium]